MLEVWIIFGILLFISWIIRQRFRLKFRKYMQLPVSGNYSGKEIAEKMLSENSIYDVIVVSSKGVYNNYYNPIKKTLNLQGNVYNGRNIAYAAIAAHETGHAIQHNMGYSLLQMRSALVPVISISSKIVLWVLLAGMFMLNLYPEILLFGIIMFATTTFFSFITLPVEIDASNKALIWLNASGITNAITYSKAKDALKLEAFTYVIDSIGSLATLIYYVKIYFGKDN